MPSDGIKIVSIGFLVQGLTAYKKGMEVWAMTSSKRNSVYTKYVYGSYPHSVDIIILFYMSCIYVYIYIKNYIHIYFLKVINVFEPY